MSFAINIKKGNYRKLRLICTYNDNITPFPLTGITIVMSVKEITDILNDDTTALIEKTITTHIDEANGITEIEFTPTDTNIPEKEYKTDLLFYTDIDTDPVNSKSGSLFITKRVTYGI